MRLHFSPSVILLVGLLRSSQAQTVIDLRTQARNIDFSGATNTRPFKAGTGLPVLCSPPDAYFRLDATPGQNIYACTGANTWSLQGTPAVAGNADKLFTTDGTTAYWSAIGGDVSGRAGSLTVTGLRGYRVGAATPYSGSLLRWNGNGNQWEPSGDLLTSVFGRTGTVTPQTGDYSFSQIVGLAAIAQGGTGSGTSAGALANLGAAAIVHSHAITDLQGITGKHGTAGSLQAFGGGVTNSDDCAKFDAIGNVVSAGVHCGGLAWDGIISPLGNLSLTLGAQTTLFLHAPSGTNYGMKWTDTGTSGGTGNLGWFGTAAGSSMNPWQADANGVGWRVSAAGELSAVGQSDAGSITFSGSSSGSCTWTVPANATAITMASAAQCDLGSSAIPVRNLYLAGSSTTPGSNNFLLTGVPSAARTWTLPDASDTFVGRNTTDILINKTIDTGATGNLFKIAGTPISSIQGNASKLLAAGAISGTGSTLCTDPNGNATTSGCASGGPGNSSTAAQAIPAGAMVVGDDGVRGIKASSLNGVLKYTAGVPSAIGGSSSNCVHEDGSSGPCGVSTTISMPMWVEFVGAICQDSTAALGFSSSSINPATAVCITGSNAQLGAAEFQSGQTVQGRFILPDDWTSGTGNDLVFRFRSVGTTGNIVFNLQTACVANTGSAVDPGWNAAQAASASAQGTTLWTNTATLSTIATAGCSAGNLLFFKLGLDATTTTTGNVDLLSARFKLIRTMSTL